MSKQKLIDGNALLEKKFDICADGKCAEVVDAFDVENAPTVDTERHGEWIRPTDEFGDELPYECSRCGEHPLLAGDESDELSKYCPRCGAKMDGDKHD